MFDTIGFYIPISEANRLFLMEKGLHTERIDRETGFVEFEYTNFCTHCSYNYRVQWKVDNKHFLYDQDLKASIEVEGVPYLRVEFAAPKMLYGHNLESIDVEGMLDSCLAVLTAFKASTGIDLPGPGWWYPYRVDTCANYLMQNGDEVKSYIRYLQRLDYPRRKGNQYSDTGLYFVSGYNTLKIYYKGDEFKKHDASRFDDEVLRKKLQNDANKILRVEVELKRRIKYLIDKYEKENAVRFVRFKGWVSLEELLIVVNLKDEMEHVMKKFLVGRETKITSSVDVLSKLCAVYSERQAQSFFAIYMIIVLQGQNEAKRRFNERTYYRALRAFRENEISLVASDVKIDENFKERSEFECILGRGFPVDFSLKMDRSNKYYQLPLVA